MCSEHQLNEIKQIVIECYEKTYGKNIVDIILYGSYARGDFSEGSDIDITAIVRGERVELQEKLKEVWDATAELGLENDVVVSPSVIPYDEYMKYKETLPYYRNIAEEGQKIGRFNKIPIGVCEGKTCFSKTVIRSWTI
jgi:predicted nucleotidyltransferase